MIWCVEDDSGIREIEVYTLNSTGFSARGFADAASFRKALEMELPELVLLDVMLATAKGMEYDKIQSLDMGADDYLVKPFGMMEMVSRVKAVLRRCAPQQQSQRRQLTAGGVTLDPDEHTVTVEGQRIQLTFKEFELLRLFLTHVGMAFTRDQLFNDVWGADYVGETRTVDMHIRTLRQKLGACGSHIETVRGVGYRWEAQS